MKGVQGSGSGVRDAVYRAATRRFFYGWAILAVAATGIFASGPGQSHTFSVFIGPIGEDLGLSRTTIASAYGLATLVAALGLPQMGRLVDRYGARRLLLIVAALLGTGCLGFGAVTGVISLALGFIGLRFLGQGSLMLACANLVSQWFGRRRGFALSLMALGFAASMAVHPPLAQWLTDLMGWRQAWLWLGVITWVLVVPPVLVVVHNKPEDLGLRPDGEGPTADQAGARTGASGAAAGATTGLTLREALGTSAFYIIAAGRFALSMLVTALHFFQVSIFGAHGLGPQVAAQVFSVSAITMVLAMPVVGRMLDRFPTERMFAAGLVVMAGALVSATRVSDLATGVAYAVVFGLANAVTLTFSTFLWPHYFGRRSLGSIQGTGQMIAIVGAALGPLPLGVASDHFGSYDATLLALAGLPVICAVLSLFLRVPAMPVREIRPT